MTEKTSLFCLIVTLTIVSGGTSQAVESPSMANQPQFAGVITTNSQLIVELSPNIAQQTNSPLITWKEFVEQGGRRFVNRDYDIPSEFRNGYVYINSGADNTTAYILKQGLLSYPPKANRIAEIDDNLGNQYVKSGQAIRFNWGGSSGYFQRHGRDTEVRFEAPGLGCLRLTCLEAPFMSKEQITGILHSEKQIPQKN